MLKFIRKLQNSDDNTKRKWMFILTAIAMIIIIYVWLAYFNNLVASFSAPQKPIAAEDTGFGFWTTMKNGAVLVYRGFMDKLRLFAEILGEPREYIINPSR